MKSYYLLIALFVVSCLASCKKNLDADPTTSTTLTGKWDLVNDSSAYGESYITKTNYVGVPGDYFDFRANGNVYIKEGANYDTLAYNMVGGDSVVINTFNVNNYPDVITPLTGNRVSIYSGSLPIFWVTKFRMVNLKK